MAIKCVWEHNGADSLLYAADLPGAYARGAGREETLQKMQQELPQFLQWAGGELPPEELAPVIVQEKESTLRIADADSDVLFESERLPLTPEEYAAQKALALRSAVCRPRSIFSFESSMIPAVSWAAFVLRPARFLTSSATTENPRPCLPARAASTAALSASRFV